MLPKFIFAESFVGLCADYFLVLFPLQGAFDLEIVRVQSGPEGRYTYIRHDKPVG
jgi:hypothetical protein